MLKLFGYALKYNHKIGCHLSTVTCRKMSVAASKSINKRPKVFVTSNDVPQLAITNLRQACDVDVWESNINPIPKENLLERVRGIDALFCLLTNKIDSEVLAAGSQLKVIGTMSVGHDHIDLESCQRLGVAVGYTPGVLTDCVAELAVSLLLATSRRIKEGIRAVVDGEWGPWSPQWMCGKELHGSTVGIVGLGRIGHATARRLVPFGVHKFVYTSRRVSKNADEIHAEYVSFDELLRVSDFVISSCALNDETKELFNAASFLKMKKDAIFVNVSRGGVVNQSDLYDALVSGVIWGAGLDVTTPEPLPIDSPLLTLNNCTVLPHLGSATEHTRSKMAELTVQNILSALEGHPMPFPLCTPQ